MPRYISANVPLDLAGTLAVARGELVVTPDGRPPSTGSGAAAPAIGGASIQNAINAAQQGQNKANRANEARYEQALGGYDSAIKLSENLGNTARSRVEENRVNAQGSTQQSLVNRGLTNYTIADALSRGVNKDAERANQDIDEQVANRRSGLEMARGNFIASRNDIAPDLSQWASLISGAAEGAPAAQRSGSVFRNSPMGGVPTISTPSLPSGGSSGGGGAGGYFTMGGSGMQAPPSSLNVPQMGQGSISSALQPPAQGPGSITIAGSQGSTATNQQVTQPMIDEAKRKAYKAGGVRAVINGAYYDITPGDIQRLGLTR